MSRAEVDAGLVVLRDLFTQNNFAILETSRPWQDREASYLRIGRLDDETDLALSDDFLSDLPNTGSHRASAKAYAEAVGGRLRVGNPNIFYCSSERVIEAKVTWPMQSGFYENRLISGLRVHIKDLVDETVARCSYVTNELSYSPSTPLDDYVLMINIIRDAIDNKLIEFLPQKQAKGYQKVDGNFRRHKEMGSGGKIERFLIGKTYLQGFKSFGKPAQTWLLDPWDADYLGVTVKDLSHAAHVTQAKKLILLDSTSNYGLPSDKLITEGLSALVAPTDGVAKQEFTLTKLPNKERFNEDVTQYLKSGSVFAMVLIDLDNFKSVNDTNGHSAGDACLEAVVRVIGGVLGRKGTLYRWGGDEFSICLPDFSTDEAAATAERIRVSIEQARPGQEIVVTVSIGVAASDQDHGDEGIFNAADSALYKSKKQGRNQVTVARRIE